jgi:hypothetical protein
MAARMHRPLKIIAFNANGFWRRRYELSKQQQDLYTDVTLFSETHLKSHETFIIPNYHFYRTGRFPERKGIPHNHVDLCYMCDTYTWKRWSLFIREKPIISWEKMLHEDYGLKGSVANKNSGRVLQGAWHQDEIFGSKAPVVK